MTQPYLKATTINIDNITGSPTYFSSSPTLIPTVAGAYNYAAFWQPLDSGLSINGTQYYYTGTKGVGTLMTNMSLKQSYMPLTPQLVLAPSDGNVSGPGSLLKAPTGYINVWNWNSSAYAWQPVAPAGYIALGVVFTSTSTAPTLTKFMCVRQDLCFSSLVSPDHIVWSNNFTLGPTNMWISMWNLPNATSCAMVSSGYVINNPVGYNQQSGANTYVPTNAVLWDLKQPVF